MGWSEIFLIGIVALIVVGPKDLPGMFRELGRFSARVKGMAREFQRAMEDAADQSGVGDISKTLRNATNPKAMGLDALNKATKWDAATSKANPPLDKDRAEVAAKINEASAKAATKRLAAEAEAAKAAAQVAPEAPDAPAPATPEAKS